MREYNVEESVKKFNEDQMKYVEIFKEMERGAEVLPFIGKGTVMLKEDIGEVVVNASFDGTEEGMDSNFSNTTEEFYNKLRVGDEVEVVMIGFNTYVLPKANTEYAEDRYEEVRNQYPQVEKSVSYKEWEKKQRLSPEGELVVPAVAMTLTVVSIVLVLLGNEASKLLAVASIISWVAVGMFSRYGVKRYTKRKLKENKKKMYSTEAVVLEKSEREVTHLKLSKNGISFWVQVPKGVAEDCEVGDKVVYFKNLGLEGAVSMKSVESAVA